MDRKICLNAKCGARSSRGWKHGWILRSGLPADLCQTCGVAFEQSRFCENFHSDDAGWRTCSSCRKRVHCGCIASMHSFVLLDGGGVECISCADSQNSKNLLEYGASRLLRQSVSAKTPQRLNNEWKAKACCSAENTSAMYSTSRIPQIGSLATEVDRVMIADSDEESNGESNDKVIHLEGYQIKQEQNSSKEPGSLSSSGGKSFHRVSARDTMSNASTSVVRMGAMVEQVKLSGIPNIAVDTVRSSEHLGGTTTSSLLSNGEFRETLPRSSIPNMCRPKKKQILPCSSITHLPVRSESASDLHTASRLPRPQGENKGLSQLLPRYRPQITDQEIQQITSGDSNSILTPLFGKMLSASDAGRIGRFVLPKTCAEAYFPPISSPEGQPIDIHDVSGKKWTFQFRYWPNNSSRMYVLEGVTPYIRSMQLQAGDTVTFSRLDPEGKLVMGCSGASTLSQEPPVSAGASGSLPLDDVDGPNAHGLRSMPSPHDKEPHALNVSQHPRTGYTWDKTDSRQIKVREGSESETSLLPDKIRRRPLGNKSKRLCLDNADALELKLTCEQAQGLLRPPPDVIPSIVIVDGEEFEEYEEPPIIAKKTIFSRQQSRASCSAPMKMSNEQLEKFLCSTDQEKQEDIGDTAKDASSNLDTLADAAACGGNSAASSPPPAPTTKHPRQRPGCACIVCIQPPSGKGPKHKPNCVCNVCMTVKRRFKTLVMHRKKHESEREAETASKKLVGEKHGETTYTSKWEIYRSINSENSKSTDLVFREGHSRGDKVLDVAMNLPFQAQAAPHRGNNNSLEEALGGKGQIDLNIQPERDDGGGRMSMMKLLQDASLPLSTYLQQQQGLSEPIPMMLPVLSCRLNERTEQQNASKAEAPITKHSSEEAFESFLRVDGDSAAAATISKAASQKQ